jgi:hypothetical protein
MAAYNVRKPGYPTLGELAIDLINDLVMGSAAYSGTTTTTTGAPGGGIAGAKGFRLVYPSTLPNKTDNLDVATGYIKSTTAYTFASTGLTIPVARYILECTTEVDAITTTTQTNPATFSFGNTTLTDGWRICIEFPLVDTTATSTLTSTVTTTTGAPGVQPTSVGVGPPVIFKEFMAVYVGTSVQLRNDGTVVALPSIPTTPGGVITFLEPAGMLGAEYRPLGGTPISADALKPPVTAVGGFPGQAGAPASPGAAPAAPAAGSWDVGFYNRIGVTRDSGYAVPLTYELTMSKRGVFFGIWDLYSETSGSKFNWVVIQRSVDRASGAIRGRIKTKELGTDTYTNAVEAFLSNTSNSVAPVWCVNSVNNKYYKFNPREKDLGGPSIRTSATDNTEDSTSIINPFDQQSLTDDSKYVITFLSNLNTNRFKYPDELDLVGTVSADVIGSGTEATVTVYNEPIDRVYRALPPNAPYGTGMRLVSFVKWTKTYTLTSASTSGTTATIGYATLTVAPFTVGTKITVTGFGTDGLTFNGIFTIVTCTTSAITFTLSTAPTTPPTPATFGTVTGEIVAGPISETPPT